MRRFTDYRRGYQKSIRGERQQQQRRVLVAVENVKLENADDCVRGGADHVRARGTGT